MTILDAAVPVEVDIVGTCLVWSWCLSLVPVTVVAIFVVDDELDDDDEHDDDDIVALLLLLSVVGFVKLLLLLMLNRWALITVRGVKRYDVAMSDPIIADSDRGLRATTALLLALEDERHGPEDDDTSATGGDGRCGWNSHSEAAKCGGMSNAADKLAAVVA